MSKRISLILFLSLHAATSAGAADVLKFDSNDPELVQAREAKSNLLVPDNGFEASGASELANTRLPVVGVLPSELGAVFAAPTTGFEGAPKVPLDSRSSGVKTIPGSTSNKLEYSISYQHIADGLDAVCIGTRLTRKIKLRSGLGGPATNQATTDANDELRVAHAEQKRYGLPYRCDVYCSDAKATAYCHDNTYAEKMLERAKLLAPGQPD